MGLFLAALLGLAAGLALGVLLARRRAAPPEGMMPSGEAAQTDHLAEAGRRLAEVAHEINNPLTAIQAFAQDLLRAEPTAEQREALGVILQQARKSRLLVRGLLDHVRAAPVEDARVVVSTLLETVTPVLTRLCREHEVELRIHADSDLPDLLGEAGGLEQVLTNLVQNAAQATPVGGWVALTARVRGRLLEFVVQDTGPGIPLEHRDRIFEPFFTTKGSGEGTGLGLAVCQGIVRRHRGTLVAENVPAWEGGGARFTVSLPFVDRRRNERELPADDAAPVLPAATRRLLVVEDDDAIRTALRRYLQRRGWVVEELATGEEALARLRQRAPEARLDAVLCDIRLPSLSGLAVYERIRQEQPALARRIVLVSGDARAPEVVAFQGRTDVVILEKPFELSALGRALDAAARGEG